MVRGVKLRSRSSSSMRSRSAVMYTSFKVSITVLTHPRYNTCRVSGLVQIPISLACKCRVHSPQDLFAQLPFFQSVPELAHRGLVRRWLTPQINAHELPHHRGVV